MPTATMLSPRTLAQCDVADNLDPQCEDLDYLDAYHGALIARAGAAYRRMLETRMTAAWSDALTAERNARCRLSNFQAKYRKTLNLY